MPPFSTVPFAALQQKDQKLKTLTHKQNSSMVSRALLVKNEAFGNQNQLCFGKFSINAAPYSALELTHKSDLVF